jgi:hypothetical protein
VFAYVLTPTITSQKLMISKEFLYAINMIAKSVYCILNFRHLTNLKHLTQKLQDFSTLGRPCLPQLKLVEKLAYF